MSSGIAECLKYSRSSIKIKLNLNLEAILTPWHDLSLVCEPENEAN